MDISLDTNWIKSTVKIAMLNFINRLQCSRICIKYCKKKIMKLSCKVQTIIVTGLAVTVVGSSDFVSKPPSQIELLLTQKKKSRLL